MIRKTNIFYSVKSKNVLQSKEKSRIVIPRYLFNFKVDTVRKKIILRKYAYIFLRKTHGRILPSIAQKWYLKQIVLRNCFQIWMKFRYKQKVSWRLELRADVHYKFKCMRSCFDRWMFYANSRKNKKIKYMLVDSYYLKKLKYKCFNHLKSYKSIVASQIELQMLLEKNHSLIYQLLYFNELFLWSNCLNLQYMVIILAIKYNRRNILCKYFVKFKRYHQILQKKKRQKIKVRELFFKKFNILDYAEYFVLWKTYYYIKKEEKYKMVTAQIYFNKNIIKLSFFKLKIYYQTKLEIKEKYIQADLLHVKKLKKEIITLWIKFTDRKKEKRYLIDNAVDHYNTKMKNKLFSNWKQWYKKQMERHKKVAICKEKSNTNLSMIVFDNWKLFRMIQIKKIIAINHYNKKIAEKYFHLLIQYKEKEIRQMKYKVKIIDYYKLYKLEKLIATCFLEWKKYCIREKARFAKIAKFENNLKLKLVLKCFYIWINWANKKIRKTQNLLQIGSIFNKIVVRTHFEIWKKYTQKEKLLKLKISEGKDIFLQFTTNYVLEKFITEGNKKEAIRYSNIIENQKEIFYIKVFYFKKWKYAVWKKQKHLNKAKNMLDRFAINTATKHLQPKIPIYLNNYLHKHN